MKIQQKIVFRDIGKIVFVYNGKKLVMLRIKEDMLNHYIGEYVITKKQGANIHKHKVKKKIKGK